jgi:hypothetical protein
MGDHEFTVLEFNVHYLRNQNDALPPTINKSRKIFQGLKSGKLSEPVDTALRFVQ